MAIVFDIETNGFLEDLTTIQCVNIYDTEKHQHERYAADCLIGHNIISFDNPGVKKLYPYFSTEGKQIIDIYVWAACAFSNIKDGDFGRYRKGLLPASLIGKHILLDSGNVGLLRSGCSGHTEAVGQ